MNKKSLVKPSGRSLHLYSRRPLGPELGAPEPLHHPLKGSQHLRWHALREEWVVYASNRQNRTFLPPKEYSPLAVTTDESFPTELPAGDYDVAVFENLFPSMTDEADESPELFTSTRPAKGSCEVIVFSQDPQTSLGELALDHLELILQVWAERTTEIGARENIQYVMPFENRGVEVGVTLHHPHGQIYAYPFLPPVVGQFHKSQNDYLHKQGRRLLEDFVQDELRDRSRVIFENDGALSVIPVWARYPYETWVLPKRSVPWLSDLTPSEITDLAQALKVTLQKFDQLWKRPFPYICILYQAPMKTEGSRAWHTHFQFYPPYRSRDRLKFLAGTEIGAGLFVNDTWPEERAAELRDVRVDL